MKYFFNLFTVALLSWPMMIVGYMANACWIGLQAGWALCEQDYATCLLKLKHKEPQ